MLALIRPLFECDSFLAGQDLCDLAYLDQLMVASEQAALHDDSLRARHWIDPDYAHQIDDQDFALASTAISTGALRWLPDEMTF